MKRYLATLLLFSILISTFGIYRLDHFCLGSVAKKTSHVCSSVSDHSCCAKEKSEQNKKKESDCCKSYIKVFRSDLTTLISKYNPVEKISALIAVPVHEISQGSLLIAQNSQCAFLHPAPPLITTIQLSFIGSFRI